MDREKNNKIIEINSRKKQAEVKNKNSAKVIFLIIALAAVIVLAAVALASWGEKNEVNNVNVIDSENVLNSDAFSITNTRVKRGFPVSFSSNGIKDIKCAKKNIFVLTNEMISCLSKNGVQVYSHVLNYAEPVIKSNGDYGIAYDRLSGKYTVFNNKKILFSKSSENEEQIITACIAKNGNYAIASRNNDSASLLSYYDKSGELLFAWACSKEHIVAIDIAKNKKNILCAALNAQDGEILTKVYLLNINMSETEWETEINSAAAMDCFFTTSSKAIVMCSDRRVLLHLNSGKAPIISTFSSTALNYSSDDSGNSVVVTSKFGSFDSYDITFYNSNNAAVGTYTTNKKVTDIKCLGRKAYFLTSDSIGKASSSGKAKTKFELDDIELGLDVNKSSVYHFSLGYLYKN